MVLIPVLCPHCQSDQVIKGGTTKAGRRNSDERRVIPALGHNLCEVADAMIEAAITPPLNF